MWKTLIVATLLVVLGTQAQAKGSDIRSNLSYTYGNDGTIVMRERIPVAIHIKMKRDRRKSSVNTDLVVTYGAGVVRSKKTGAMARGVRNAHKFQAYIDDIEANGGIVKFMGGYRKGHCSPRHMHSCSAAIDICQWSRDVVDKSCHLPPRQKLAEIASRHGLFEGGQWCNGDYGHAQDGVSAGACTGTRYASARRAHGRHVRVASRHYRRHHYASAR